MQEVALLFMGSLLVIAVSIDVLHTTIHVAGSGFLTRRLNHLLWKVLPRHPKVITLAGPFIMIATVVVWFLLFWLGWSLVFAAGSASVVSDPSNTAADIFSLIYFVGFSIITLGVGDYAPNGPVWQILTVLAAASGFFVVTLVISYLLPLVSAVVEQRQLAAYIHSLGSKPEEVLELAWNGEDYTNLTSHLTSLTPVVHRQTYLHLAYPVLHYFRSAHRRSAVAPAIAVLDDALTLLIHRVPPEQKPHDCHIKPLRCAIFELLQTLRAARIIAAGNEPPVIEGVEMPQQVQEHRRLLAGWLEDQGWSWCEDERGSVVAE
jgi:hypothetical protein